MKKPDHRQSAITVYVTSLLQGALGVALPASSAILRERLSLGDTLYGSLFLPGLGLAVITSLLGHFLLRRFSLKALFLFALSTQALTMVLMAVSGVSSRRLGLPLLFAAMAISGPAGGLIGITLNTAAIELFPRARSGALAALHGILGLGSTLGPMLVALCIARGTWVAAPLALAAGLIVLLILARSRPVVGLGDCTEEEHGRSDVPFRLWLCCLPALLYGACEATFTAWAVVFLTENRHLSLEISAAALSAYWAAMTAGRLLGVVAVRRFPARRLIVLLSLGVVVAFVLVAHCERALDSMLRFAFAGLTCSALFPLLLGLTSAEFPDRTPQVSAIFSALAMIGLAIGCFALGPLRGWLGLPRVYMLSTGWPLALIVTVLFLGEMTGPKVGKPGTPGRPESPGKPHVPFV